MIIIGVGHLVGEAGLLNGFTQNRYTVTLIDKMEPCLPELQEKLKQEIDQLMKMRGLSDISH